MNDGAERRTIRILMVEDNVGDIRLVEETVRESGIPTVLESVRYGDEALAYLRGRDGRPAHEPPDLILLDLNLPRLDGRHVLAEVRSDTRLNRIPVVVFTSSPTDDDVRFAFNFHADGYVRKPLTVEEYQRIVKRLLATG